MKRAILLRVFVTFTLLLSACDTVMWSQYRVSVVTTVVEEKKLLEALARVAALVGLEDATPNSRAKDTLVFYSQPRPKQYTPLQLGARMLDGATIVEIIGGFGPKTPEFAKAEKALREEMNRLFPGRYDIPSPRVSTKPLRVQNVTF